MATDNFMANPPNSAFDYGNMFSKHNIYNINNINKNDNIEHRKAGRPKMADSERLSKNFNLLMKMSDFQALTRLAAQRQLETGEKVSVSSLVNAAVAEYLERNANS